MPVVQYIWNHKGWMYGHSFADLDGHQWEIMYMDENAIPL
jgi:predicted lactoylglutathione lyase